MPRTPLQFKRMKDERKLSILEASLPLFALYGDKVSVDMISSAAKCSHGLVYHYFKNTDEIYLELLNSLTYQNLKEKVFINFKGMYAFEALKHITITLVNEIKSSDQNVAFIILMINDSSKESLFNIVTSLVKRGQKENDVTGGETKDIANAFLFIFKGMGLQYLLNKHNKIPDLDPDVLVELFRKRSRL